jgi:hypothetical protein
VEESDMAKGKKPAFRIERVALAKIERGGGTQARVGNNEDAVVDYVEALRAGKQLPPPVVFKDEKGKLWLADGFHRVEAHARIGARSLDVEQHAGTQRDAVLYAAGANAFHGLRRTPEDKKRAVLMLLADPEWAGWSDRAIADHCHVSHPFVAKLRTSGGNVSTCRTGADGKTYDTAAVSAANRERAVERHAPGTAGTLTPDAAPARPRVTRDVVDDIPPDDVPEIEYEDPVGDGGAELVEDGAMAESYGDPTRPGDMRGLVAPARAGKIVRDANGTPVPEHLLVVWDLLTFASATDTVDHAITQLASASAAWESFQERLLDHVRVAGTDAHLPTRELPSLNNDFGPNGRVTGMMAALWRMVPHVVCDACEGDGCERCAHLGWFSQVGWKERRRVDGLLGDAGAEA